MKNNLFENLPDVLDAKLLAQALCISKSGAYALMSQPDFPTMQIGGCKLVIKPDLIEWMQSHVNHGRSFLYSLNRGGR